VIELPVQWGEMDAYQHVNNVVYLRWVESGRLAYFGEAGILRHMQETRIGPILHSTNCRFRIPLTYPDIVSVGTRVSDVGEDRFTMQTIIVSREHGRVAAESESLVVMMDYARQAKASIPDVIRRRIGELERR